MAKTLSIDIETYSNISLPKAGVYRYADDPSFEILLFAYAFDDDKVKIIDLAQSDSLPQSIINALRDPNIIKTAFNAQFERICLGKHLGITLDPSSWHCTMVHALTLGFSGRLDGVAKALKLPQDKQKMFIGKNLIRLFCVPRKPIKANNYQTRFYPADKPEEWEQFKDYCVQDVVVERELRRRLDQYPMPDSELRLYHIDQQINDYGVKLDAEFVSQAIAMDTDYSKRLANTYQDLTGLDNPNSVQQLKEWLTERLGFEVTSITKQTIPALMDAAKDIPEARQALELRQEISKTSVSKYAKMDEVICRDGRARGLLQFYGANRTGRWAGRLIQAQNLPRNNIAELDLARSVVKSGDLQLLDMIYPNVPAILSQLIRTAFIPSDGHRFIVSDFSAIEARIIAWLAGEQWRMEVFRDHGKIYEASAAQMFNVPVESIDKGNPLRQKGKIAELALGYQGGKGALIQMGALDMGLTEDELPELVKQWRAANPNIVQFWWDVGDAAKTAVGNKTTVKLQKGLSMIYVPGALFIQLPSGRRITYPNPRVEDHHKFEGATKITFDGEENKKWGRIDTYGGKLVENIVQATARDCLAAAMVRLHKAGYKIAFHVHDEVVLDVPNGKGSLKEINEIMGQPLSWAEGLPLSADGFECNYYQKD